MSNFNIDFILEKLSKERPIFHSEDDFKFSLAWIIKREYPQTKIRLEYTLDFDRSIHIDIVVILDGQLIPIELKYKTKELDLTLGAERYILKNQQATNLGCYNFIKDIKRIEEFKEKEMSNFKEGYAIFLTNSLIYEKGTTKSSYYYEFSINEGNIKKQKLVYGESKYKAIELTGEYTCKWKDYFDIGKDDSKYKIFMDDTKYKNAKKFKYLAIKIE